MVGGRSRLSVFLSASSQPAFSISTGTNVMDLRIFFLADKKGKGEK